jgi:hypothetical protein
LVFILAKEIDATRYKENTIRYRISLFFIMITKFKSV